MSEVSGEQYKGERCRVYVSHAEEAKATIVAAAVYSAIRKAANVPGGAIILQRGRWYSQVEPGFIVEVVYPVAHTVRGANVRTAITEALGEVKDVSGCTFFVTFEPVTATEIF